MQNLTYLAVFEPSTDGSYSNFPLLSPLSCLYTKTGGVVNGRRSPFILPLTGSTGFANSQKTYISNLQKLWLFLHYSAVAHLLLCPPKTSKSMMSSLESIVAISSFVKMILPASKFSFRRSNLREPGIGTM